LSIGAIFPGKKNLDRMSFALYLLTCIWNYSRLGIMNRNDFIRQLKEKGLKMTPQRVAIIDALVENYKAHPGAALIYEEARKRARRVSLSTVYATLKEFSANGLIRQLEFDRMENRYDLDFSDHVNLVCDRCGKIMDYSLPSSSLDHRDVTRKTGFVVTDTRLECHGFCRDCLKRPG